MAAISCDICGGGLSMDPSGDFANCDSCGLKHTKDRLKTKAQEITGTVEVSNMAGLESLMKRGNMALEDEKWHEASKYFDQVLDINPEYVPAYVGKLCLAVTNLIFDGNENDLFLFKVKKEADLARYYKPLDDLPEYQKAIRFADETYRVQLEGYNNEIKKRLVELGNKYSFFMIVESCSDYTPHKYSNEPVRTSMGGHCCVGTLRDGVVFKIQRTGKQHKYHKFYYENARKFSDPLVYPTEYGDIKYGDVAYITIEEERQNAEQERIARERQAALEKKDREERERKRIEEEKREQSRRWQQQGLCEHCGGSLGGIFSKKCKACGKAV